MAVPSTTEMVTVTQCRICGGVDLRPTRARTDGVMVLQCARCKMGCVERHPADLSVLYGDAYYAAESAVHATVGYDDYLLVSAHSLRWAASLVPLVKPAGAVLDVGCADGYLFEHLPRHFERFGIEVNEAMAERCRERGIGIVANDVHDKSLVERYAGRFDVIVCVAVLEHVADMRAALVSLKQLLAPGGVLLFEVPLISHTHESDIWFRSSLEHLYYPTIDGLRFLFESVFGSPPAGGELPIRAYGSTYVGLVASNPDVQAELVQLHQRLVVGPTTELQSHGERVFRFLFDVVHAAQTSPDALKLLPELNAEILDGPLLVRLAALWQLDAQARAWNAALQEAKAYYEAQASNWKREFEAQEQVHAGKIRRHRQVVLALAAALAIAGVALAALAV